jgi:hypothetical protein
VARQPAPLMSFVTRAGWKLTARRIKYVTYKRLAQQPSRPCFQTPQSERNAEEDSWIPNPASAAHCTLVATGPVEGHFLPRGTSTSATGVCGLHCSCRRRDCACKSVCQGSAVSRSQPSPFEHGQRRRVLDLLGHHAVAALVRAVASEAPSKV